MNLFDLFIINNVIDPAWKFVGRVCPCDCDEDHIYEEKQNDVNVFDVDPKDVKITYED